MIKATTAMITKTKNRSLAISTAPAAMPPKPKRPRSARSPGTQWRSAACRSPCGRVLQALRPRENAWGKGSPAAVALLISGRRECVSVREMGPCRTGPRRRGRFGNPAGYSADMADLGVPELERRGLAQVQSKPHAVDAPRSATWSGGEGAGFGESVSKLKACATPPSGKRTDVRADARFRQSGRLVCRFR